MQPGSDDYGGATSSCTSGKVDKNTDFQGYVDTQFLMLLKDGGPSSITFPGALSAGQRKYVHQTAQQQGFVSASVGEGSERRLTVFRAGAPNAPTREELQAPVPREEQLSRRLASLLRHRAQNVKLRMRPDGFARLREVLALQMFADDAFTVEEVEGLVAYKDEKQRFQLATFGGEQWIRANQGHTIRTVQDDKLLVAITEDEEIPICVHGTYLFAWEGIMRDGGLSRMNRNHIHFAPRPPGADRLISGMRSDCEVAIYISVARAMASGIQFFRSANEVILTRGDEQGRLSACHFERAVRLADCGQLWPPPLVPLSPLPGLPPAEALHEVKAAEDAHAAKRSAGSGNSSDEEEILIGGALLAMDH